MITHNTLSLRRCCELIQQYAVDSDDLNLITINTPKPNNMHSTITDVNFIKSNFFLTVMAGFGEQIFEMDSGSPPSLGKINVRN